MVARVLDAIRRYQLLGRGDRVLVALSGGSDSVALLRLLRELEQSGELTVAGVAHLNHGLRDTAHRDEQFCRALAAELGLPFRADLVDVAARALSLNTSLEVAGRLARYEMFDRVADELGADVIATGHTRDDQAETFLLRLVRGAGSRGLAGIHPRTGRVVRPLIDIGRAELRSYLESIGQGYCEDESNQDLTIPRNRIRHELIPYLQREFSPGIVDVLARDAAIARQDADRLEQEAIDLADSIVLEGRGQGTVETVETVEIDARALAALHPALASRVARLALARLASGRFIGFDHVERVLALALDNSSKAAFSLPGQHVVRRGERLVLSRQPFRAFATTFEVSLSIPGEVVLEKEGWAVSAHWAQPGSDLDFCGPGENGSKSQDQTRSRKNQDLTPVAVQADRLVLPLAVRSRKPGDRLRPAGLGGRAKKLQDLLVDRKVARERRDALPLVVDGTDTIVWVVGESVAEGFRVTEPSQGVILLKARRLGGQG
jgi:tRNA(Ile)-lysidine synthase